LSQGEFAALLGYQRKATISDLESGRQRPTPQTESALTNLETIADLDPSRFARP
jgi:DNA-binding transcriptional regulator YiaG